MKNSCTLAAKPAAEKLRFISGQRFSDAGIAAESVPASADRGLPDGESTRSLSYPNMSFILPSSERSMGWLSTFERASSSCSNSFWRLFSLAGTWTRTST